MEVATDTLIHEKFYFEFQKKVQMGFLAAWGLWGGGWN